MRGNGLSPKRKQKFKKTTDSQHNKAVASNLLDQNFSAEAPNEKWAADISYIWTAQGWLYLAVMLDLYSRRVIGWAVGARMTSDLPLRALNRAIGLRQPGAGVIHHSDSEYLRAGFWPTRASSCHQISIAVLAGSLARISPNPAGKFF